MAPAQRIGHAKCDEEPGAVDAGKDGGWASGARGEDALVSKVEVPFIGDNGRVRRKSASCAEIDIFDEKRAQFGAIAAPQFLGRLRFR